MAENVVTFLGTAGARVVVTKQLLASGGMWLNLNGVQLLVDPGPGCIVHAAKKKLDATKLSAIILSHKHLDHSGDINIMIEAMTEGGFKRRGIVFAPQDALEPDPVIFSYLRGFPQQIIRLQENQSYEIDGLSFRTSARHRHGVETYGFVFQAPGLTFSYIPDTAYFPELASSYGGKVVIVNVVRLSPGGPSLRGALRTKYRSPQSGQGPFLHLSLEDAKELISQIKPRAAILTHFGMTMWRAHPWEVAQQLSQRTGIKVIAARDGQSVDLIALSQLGPVPQSQVVATGKG